MSASMYLSSPYDRLAIDADEGTLTIRSRNEYGLSIDRVSLRLTSADRDAMRIALDILDTADADADAADTTRPTAPHSPAASRDLGTAVSNTANAVGTFIAQGASAMREMNAAKKALADARTHLA